LREPGLDGPPGALVELVDRRDQPLCWGLTDEGVIAVRVLGHGTAPASFDAWLKGRITAAARLRRALLGGDDTDAWRLVCGEGDGLSGLIVDRYGALAVLRLYGEAWAPHLDAIVGALVALPEITSVYQRFGVKRVDDREGGLALAGAEPDDLLVVREHGMKMIVRPKSGQKTGMFLDQREHRALVRKLSRGRDRAANLFGYTGGFSIAAVLGGARRVVTVDQAPAALADAREVFRLNGVDPDRHGFEQADAFAWRSAAPLDLLIVDPPTLARDKNAVAAAVSAYRNLHRALGPSVAPDGLLVSASCTARVSADRWLEAVAEGLGPTGPWSRLWSSTEPVDHPTDLVHVEGRYLKLAVLHRRPPA
jgi:23S rRNA (cytosine1962-C5)-methyltransferase